MQGAPAEKPQATVETILSSQRPRQPAKTVRYMGRAEADGRSAELELRFKDSSVSGRLYAKGNSAGGVYLTTTDISFSQVPLSGPWEDPGTSIVAPWTGGDYMNGSLMPDYPTNGTLTVKLAERADGNVVYLHRVASSRYGYVFQKKGLVYSPEGTYTNAAPTNSIVSAGYWDPAGRWSGKWQPLGYGPEKRVVYQADFTEDGAVRMTISGVATAEKINLKGQWRRQGEKIAIDWMEPSLEDAGVTDTSTVFASFGGPDTLLFATEAAPITLSRETTTVTGGNTGISIEPSQVVGIELSRTTLTVFSGTNYAVPEISVVLRGTGKRVPLPNGLKPSWTGFKDVSVDADGKRIIVAKQAKTGESGFVRVEVKVGERFHRAKCHVSVISTESKLGSISGTVKISFYPHTPPACGFGLRSSVVMLDGPGGAQWFYVNSTGKYRFWNLLPGRYTLRIERVKLPLNLPGEFVSAPPTSQNMVELRIPNSAIGIAGTWDINEPLYWVVTKTPPPTDYCVYGNVTHRGKGIPFADVTLVNHDGSSSRTKRADKHGVYTLNTQGMLQGQHFLMVEKYVDTNNVPPWATDGDLLDIASHSGAKKPLSVVLPILALGEQVHIPCLTRKELLETPGAPTTPPNTVANPIAP